MTISMEIPAEWLVEAGLQSFSPKRSAFQCAGRHQLLALDDIEPLIRAVVLDANGFNRTRMLSLLNMIRDDLVCEAPIEVFRQEGQRPYRLYNGVHRYYASRTLGFTHVPADILEPW